MILHERTDAVGEGIASDLLMDPILVRRQWKELERHCGRSGTMQGTESIQMLSRIFGRLNYHVWAFKRQNYDWQDLKAECTLQIDDSRSWRCT